MKIEQHIAIALAVGMVLLTSWLGCKTIPIPDPVTTTTTTTTSTTTTTLPNGRWCECDLTQPVVQPPYTAAELAADNSFEIPLYLGKDVRFFVHRTDASTDWCISHPFQATFKQNADGTFTVGCNPSYRGVQWHVQGYHEQSANRALMVSGDTFRLTGPTMCVFAECRRLP